VRQHVEDLRNAVNQGISGSIAYKSMDVDALLNRNHTREALKASLLEIDASWRLLYEKAAALSQKNKELMVETLSKSKSIKGMTAEKEDYEVRIKALERNSNTLLLENRYLKSALKKYLYPAIANEILKNECSLENVDTDVSQEAMAALVETDAPLSFSTSIAGDKKMLSREELLLEGMVKKIHEYKESAPENYD
jgi:hypothetical protein